MGPSQGDLATGSPVAVRVGALDGLRGAAVLGVMAFHLAALDGGDRHGLLGGGWLGVDVFFTLSGYLITSLLLVEAGRSGGVDLRAFWRRRVRRLQPAALVAVVGIAASAAWWSPAGTAAAARGQAMAAITGLANWQSLWTHRPYSAGASASGFEHFWSLAVEEQFYLVWPLVVALIVVASRRSTRIALRASVGTVAVAGVGLSWLLLTRFPLQRGYVGTDARMGSILLGAVLATFVPMGRRAVTARGARVARAGTWVGVTVTAVLWVGAGWPPKLPISILLPVQGLATVAVLAGVLLVPSSLPARALAWRPLTGIGAVSFGLYLWHWPVFVLLTPARLGTGWLVTTTIRLTAVAALTAMSWLLVERPVRRGIAFPRTRIALPIAVASVATLALVAVHAVQPAPAWASAHGALVVHPDATGEGHRVLIVGDSIPTSLANGPSHGAWQVGHGHLLDDLGVLGIVAASATISGCPVIEQTIVVDGDDRDSCVARQRKWLPAAMDSFRPDVVVWYSRQDAYPVKLADGSISNSSEARRDRYAARVHWFARRGARVLFVSPGPNADGSDADGPGKSSIRAMADLDRDLRDVAASEPTDVAGVVPMAELLCGAAAEGCPDRAPDGTRFRPYDGVHFDGPGNDAAATWLAEQIAAVVLSPGAPAGR